MAKCKHFDICGLNAEIGFEGFCILHYANPNKDKKAFAKKFEEHRKNRGDDFRYFIFPEMMDFQGATFTEAAKFMGATFTEGAKFMGATFIKPANFSGATFDLWADFMGATFTEAAIFFTATFTKPVDFSEATFTGAAYFRRDTFTEGADFTRATFIKPANFSDATFTEAANFSGATFTKLTNFSGATFDLWADFSGATFTEEPNFSGVKFTGGVDFWETIFEGGKENKVNFEFSKFLGRTLFIGKKEKDKETIGIFKNVEVNFKNVDINPPSAVIFRDADLSRCSFLGTRVDKIEFTGVKWAVIREKWGYSRTGIYDEKILLDSIEQEKKSKKKDKKILNWEHIERVYCDLKTNHMESGDHERAGDFHYGEKEMRRRNPDTPFFHRILLNLYRIISGYGESYLRPLIWAVVMLVFCTFGYLLLGISEVTKFFNYELKIPLNIANPMDWIKTSLYSLQVMAFMRPTYLEHTSLASTGLKVFQSIFGPVIIGLFALALRQRLKR